MTLQWYCILAILMTVSNATVDVERTIKQVQDILETNPQLPQLTREEIIQLLDEISSEDAKTKLKSADYSTEMKEFMFTTPYDSNGNEISSTKLINFQDNIVADVKNVAVTVPVPTETPIETTTKCEKSVMVVLPYTSRDGASLQELYTRPPRVEVFPESKVTPRSITEKAKEKLRETLKSNAQLANKQKIDIPNELETFLESHGLKGKPGQDFFLLPLEERFKSLPPVKVTEKSGELPEHIVFLYDLISQNSDVSLAENNDIQTLSPNNFLYEPLQPELPSIMKKPVLPLHTSISRHRKIKSTNNSARAQKPNKESIIRDLTKNDGFNQIEDRKGDAENEFRKRLTYVKFQRQVSSTPIAEIMTTTKVNNASHYPIEHEKVNIENEFDKRQNNMTSQKQQQSVPIAEITTTTAKTTTTSSNSKKSFTNGHSLKDSETASSNSGASIADLEESFGGAAPEQPGSDSLPPPKRPGFYWMLDWNTFLKVDGDKEQRKLNIRFEPKLGDPQRFLP